MVKIILISFAIFLGSTSILIIGIKSKKVKDQHIIYSLIVALVSLIIFMWTSAIFISHIGR